MLNLCHPPTVHTADVLAVYNADAASRSAAQRLRHGAWVDVVDLMKDIFDFTLITLCSHDTWQPMRASLLSPCSYAPTWSPLRALQISHGLFEKSYIRALLHTSAPAHWDHSWPNEWEWIIAIWLLKSFPAVVTVFVLVQKELPVSRQLRDWAAWVR